MTSKIFWDPAEVELLVEHAAQALLDDPRKEASSRVVSAARQAQEAVLPISRQREIKSCWNIRNLMDLIPKRIDELIKARACVKEQEPPVAEVSSSSSSSASTCVNDSMSLEALIAMLMDRFADRITNQVVDRIATILASTTSTNSGYYINKTVAPEFSKPTVKHNPEVVSPTKEKKLTIGVIGLLNSQQRVLESKFTYIRFCFIHSKASLKHPPSVDHMVGMVGFMGHAMDASASSQFGLHYHRVSNGMTNLSSKIVELQSRWNQTR